MRFLVMASMMLVLVGVIFVAGSLFMVPYTVREPTRVDRSKVWADDAFVLPPFTNKTFAMDSVVQNVSIIQIDVNSSDFVVFKIISFKTSEVWFEEERRWEQTYYWTPPSLGYGIWRFVFQNPSSASIDAAVKITEFYLKITEYQNVTHYRSLLDPVYGYSGIIAIIVATTLNLIQASRDAKRKSQQPDQEAPPL